MSKLCVSQFEMGMFQIGMTFIGTLLGSNKHILDFSKQLYP
jgi:hypothetical protein